MFDSTLSIGKLSNNTIYDIFGNIKVGQDIRYKVGVTLPNIGDKISLINRSVSYENEDY